MTFQPFYARKDEEIWIDESEVSENEKAMSKCAGEGGYKPTTLPTTQCVVIRISYHYFPPGTLQPGTDMVENCGY